MKATKLTIIVVAIAILAGIVTAAYIVESLPSVDVHVATPVTLSQVSVNATNILVGDRLLLSTTWSDGSSSQGIEVDFYSTDDAYMGSATTDLNGVASMVTDPAPTSGTFSFYATATHPHPYDP